MNRQKERESPDLILSETTYKKCVDNGLVLETRSSNMNLKNALNMFLTHTHT